MNVITQFATDSIDSQSATPSLGDALSNMSTGDKVFLGLGTVALLGGTFALGMWYAGRKAEDVADQATAKATPVAAAAPVATPAPAAAVVVEPAKPAADSAAANS